MTTSGSNNRSGSSLSAEMPNIFSRLKMARDTLSPLCFNQAKQLHSSNECRNYESVIKKLNSLQTNAAVLQQLRDRGRSSHVEQVANVEATTKYLLRTGVSLEKLDSLSVIHVSGTKGKGTTCALCESILRENGYRTGFYSSPHLVAVKERIRINGAPLTNHKFAEHFNQVYDLIESKKEHENDMPAYFKFLTVLAFNVFIKERVDVAIVEVGIGGEYDCTNCIRSPSVVGITSLGYDHTKLLGETLTEIAWQKAGIMKPGAVAFTIPQKSSEALQVVKERAMNRQCRLLLAPPLDSYHWDASAQLVRNVDNVQSLNMSLALQLANEWMKLQSPFTEAEVVDNRPSEEDEPSVPVAKPFPVSNKMATGLRNCSWPGRTQIIPRENVTFFLDGAHTEESIEYCLNWFSCSSKLLQNGVKYYKILIFNSTGQRDADRFLRILSTKNFDVALFSSNRAHTDLNASSDQMNFNTTMEDQQKRSETHLDIWRTFNEHAFAETSQIVPTVSEALTLVSEFAAKQDGCVHVLITGSLHLVGAALGILDPDLSEPVYHLPLEMRPLHSVYNGLQAIL